MVAVRVVAVVGMVLVRVVVSVVVVSGEDGQWVGHRGKT